MTTTFYITDYGYSLETKTFEIPEDERLTSVADFVKRYNDHRLNFWQQTVYKIQDYNDKNLGAIEEWTETSKEKISCLHSKYLSVTSSIQKIINNLPINDEYYKQKKIVELKEFKKIYLKIVMENHIFVAKNRKDIMSLLKPNGLFTKEEKRKIINANNYQKRKEKQVLKEKPVLTDEEMIQKFKEREEARKIVNKTYYDKKKEQDKKIREMIKLQKS